MHREAGKVQDLKDLRCSSLIALFTLKRNLNTIFADGFADLFSGVALPVSTNNLKRNSAKNFTKPNKLNKQNEEASIL